MRSTIDYGIDLGTTNSCVAVINGIEAEVLKNNYQEETTTSCVWVKDDGKTVMVGKPAREMMGRADGLDIFSRFKRSMGEPTQFTAQKSGRVFTSPQLSAEVLKELKKTVRLRKNEDITAAVVTVPAKFGLAQTNATFEAATQAGFERIELVQEPVAAALAYGFQHNEGKHFHLIYDMGAGTFDAALIRINDGLIEVLNQGGDNQLGGSNIDNDILEKILVPILQKEYGLRDFSRGSQYGTAYRKLLANIETAKIQLSNDQEASLSIDRLCQGVDFLDVALTRAEIEPIIEPIGRRSINILDKVIGDANLSKSDIESILLVGGPTHTPLLRSMLEEYGVPVVHTIDPMTVVAQGAAIFASTQIMKQSKSYSVPVNGVYSLEVEYPATGADEEVPIGGKVVPPAGKTVSGLSLEFTERKSGWRSGNLQLRDNGAFLSTLVAERGRRNEFNVSLIDSEGRSLSIEPNVLPYTIGATISRTILTDGFGYGLENGEMDILVNKGASLPAEGRNRDGLQSTRLIRRGQATDVFVVPIYQGENARKADANMYIGKVDFCGKDISRDLPENQKVEISIIVDSSQQVKASIYIPYLDEQFEKIIDPRAKAEDPKQVDEQVTAILERLNQIKQQADDFDNEEAVKKIHSLEEEEKLVERLNRANKASLQGDKEATSEASNLIRSIKNGLDEVEMILELPKIEAEAAETAERVEELMDEAGNGSERRTFRRVKQELDDAISRRNAKIAKEKLDELEKMRYQILFRIPNFWVGWFQHLSEPEQRNALRDKTQAKNLFAQGNAAIERKDIDQLRSVIFQLLDLLPEEERAKASTYQSTVRR